jgi:type I restriction enzyme S subunit
MEMKKYDSYKDSGVEWISEIPIDWKVKRLKFFVKICNGKDHKEVNDENGEYPIFGSGGQFGTANEYLYHGPSVLLGRKGTVDKPRFVDKPFWTVDTAYFTKNIEGNDIRFFFYLSKTINFDLYKYGSAIPSMTQGTLNDIEFCSPKLEEQTQIANYLDQKTTQLDDLISKKQKLIDLLNEERTAIINKAVTKGLDPNVPMKDSGIEWLGEIPEGWEVKKVKHFTKKIGSGVTPRGGAEVYQDSGIPLLRSQNIYFDYFKLDNVAYISKEIHDSMSNSKVTKGDLLLNITGGSIGRCFFVSDELEEANVNQHVCIVRPNELILTEYLHFLFSSSVGQLQIDLCQQSGNREALNFEQLKNFPFTLPSIDEQSEIIKIVNTRKKVIKTSIEKTLQEIELLKEYKTALISEVVTGKVDVRDEKLN